MRKRSNTLLENDDQRPPGGSINRVREGPALSLAYTGRQRSGSTTELLDFSRGQQLPVRSNAHNSQLLKKFEKDKIKEIVTLKENQSKQLAKNTQLSSEIAEMQRVHEQRYDNLSGSRKYTFLALDDHIEELQKELEIL